MRVDDLTDNGSGTYRSPRHRLPSNSIDEASKCVSMTRPAIYLSLRGVGGRFAALPGVRVHGRAGRGAMRRLRRRFSPRLPHAHGEVVQVDLGLSLG